MSKPGKLLMIAAPSGAGKSSLVNAFLARHADWELSISTTTRAPRPGEVDGREYCFTSREAFMARRDQGAFLEWAEVHGNFYGTSKDWIEAKLAQSKNVILEIDWQGARQIRALFQNPGKGASEVGSDKASVVVSQAALRGPSGVALASVFILPPSIEALAHRLRARGQDSEEVIARRLAAAESEMAHADEFDYVIINQDFSDALQKLEAFAQSMSQPD